MKNKKVALVGALSVLVVIITLFVSVNSPMINRVSPYIAEAATCVKKHDAIVDRLNPFVSETVSYAQVPEKTQQYVNVEIIDPKSGKNRSYKIKEITGYDPSRKYIKIDHKGQYVKTIDYVSDSKFLKIKK